MESNKLKLLKILFYQAGTGNDVLMRFHVGDHRVEVFAYGFPFSNVLFANVPMSCSAETKPFLCPSLWVLIIV